MPEENQMLEFEKQRMIKCLQNMEVLVHKYHNVVQEASSFKTLDMAQILLPQIKNSFDTLQRLQYQLGTYANVLKEEKQK